MIDGKYVSHFWHTVSFLEACHGLQSGVLKFVGFSAIGSIAFQPMSNKVKLAKCECVTFLWQNVLHPKKEQWLKTFDQDIVFYLFFLSYKCFSSLSWNMLFEDNIVKYRIWKRKHWMKFLFLHCHMVFGLKCQRQEILVFYKQVFTGYGC